ncbi:MAG: hypothetical protein WCP87_04910 [Atribacterota bacterium]|nr:hypothetical protein [Candidatus Atribacteria bacterium]
MPREILGTKYYNIHELSELLGIGEVTLRSYFVRGIFKGKKLSNSWHLSEQDLRNYMDMKDTPVKRGKS